MKNIEMLKKLEGKAVRFFFTDKRQEEKEYSDGSATSFTYVRNGKYFDGKIESVEGDNVTSNILISSDSWGDLKANYYGAINTNIIDHNNCAAVCSEHDLFEIELL